MFFFIAGIQPKTIDLSERPALCPSCGLYQARLKRVDHYLSIFFLPILRVKKGGPFFQCQRCGTLSRESGAPMDRPQAIAERPCPYCGQPLQPPYRFCPACGKKVA